MKMVEGTIVGKALRIQNAIAITRSEISVVEELTGPDSNGHVPFEEWNAVHCKECGEVFSLLGNTIFSDVTRQKTQYETELQTALSVDHQETRGDRPPHWKIYNLECLFADPKFNYTYDVMGD
jgi:hypothetical protein